MRIALTASTPGGPLLKTLATEIDAVSPHDGGRGRRAGIGTDRRQSRGRGRCTTDLIVARDRTATRQSRGRAQARGHHAQDLDNWSDLRARTPEISELATQYRIFAVARRKQHTLMGEGRSRPATRAATPPTRAAGDSEYGVGKGRSGERPPLRSPPATGWIMPSSSVSVGSSGGKIPGRRAASIELPARRANRQQIVAVRSGDPAMLLGHRPIAAVLINRRVTDLSLAHSILPLFLLSLNQTRIYSV
jgi:hypothetical protein